MHSGIPNRFQRLWLGALRWYARNAPCHYRKGWFVSRLGKLAFVHRLKEPLETSLWFGARLLCRPADGWHMGSYYFGSHEWKTEKLLCGMIRSGECFVDVGANIGIYTLLAASRVGPSGRVLALEPIPATFAQLKENIALNGYADVTALPIAAWHEQTTLSMECPVDPSRHDGTFRVTVLAVPCTPLTVEARPLDAILEKVGTVHWIKMDIEGAELFALRGAEKTIRRCKPRIVLELDDKHTRRFPYHPDEIFNLLGDWGYRAARIGETYEHGCPVAEPEPVERYECADNYLFTPP